MKLNIIIKLFVVTIAIAILYIFFQFRSIANKTIIKTQNSKEEAYTTLEQKLSHKKPFTLLLLGYAGGKHDGTYLTDSMIAARIDPATKNAYLISIPRDTWISIPGNDGTQNHWKINAAYQIGLDDKGFPNKSQEFTGQSGGANLVKYVAKQVIGQPIDYFFAIDFAGFKNTIDVLGGVDVNVETTFDDYAYPLDTILDESCGHSSEEIEKFTATVSAEPVIWEYFSCRYKHLHFDKGITHMNGTTALEYVRSRHSAVDGSDFGRAKRQRNLLLAVKQKILSAEFIPKILPFMESLGNNVKTDISISDIQAILKHINEFDAYQIHTFALTDKNYLNITTASNGASILASKEGIDNWSKIHSWVSDIFAGKPEQTPMIVRVENGTKKSGLAIKVTEALQNASIQTVDPVNSKEKSETTTITVYNKSLKPTDLAILLKMFNVKSVSYETQISDEYNVKVVIGANYIQETTTDAQPQ